MTIHILNGTGKTGQASQLMSALVLAGYDVNNIKYGNADTTDYEGTTITSRADLEEIVMSITKILKLIDPEIKNGIPNTNPNEGNAYDIEIITGKTMVNANENL